MLQQQSTNNGVVFYFSPLLRAIGVPHAFSTRIGGISPPPFASLNLGNPNGCEFQDDYDRIWENYRLLQKAAGCLTVKPCRVHQVHGATVARVVIGEEFDTATKADAIVTDDPSRVISVRVADCVPILVASGDGKRVAAIHAGWRGVVAGVVGAAMRELASPYHGRPASAGDAEGHGRDARDTRNAEFVAAIGPCISYEAFEVGSEVLVEFRRVFDSEAPCRDAVNGKGYVDLREAVRRQLIAAGVDETRIDTTDRCTWRNREEFYSHRRDNGVTGRMAAVIQCK